MAVTPIHVEWLLAAKRDGIAFGRMLTLGRQHWLVEPGVLTQCCLAHGLPVPGNEADLRRGGWADRFFCDCLGVHDLVAVDNSDFEGAEWLADLNERVAPEKEEGFDVVLDLGTLEHVFNFPEALRNCMRLVKTGGVFLWSLPANNQCGHGFYQFSPELVFRAFAPENGFELLRTVLAEPNCPNPEFSTQTTLYAACDPDTVGDRAAFVSPRVAGMLVTARRARAMPIFARWPQQSDYLKRWRDGDLKAETSDWRKRAGQLLAAFPPMVRCFAITWYQRLFGMKLGRTRHYRRIDRL